MTRHVPVVAFVVLVLAFLGLMIGAYEAAMTFEFEQSAFLHGAFDWTHGGRFDSRGPPVGPFQYHHGPVFGVLLGLLMFVSTDPLVLRWLFCGLFACAGGLLFVMLRRVVSWPVALFAVATLFFSRFGFEVTRQLWHASLIPVFACGFLFGAARLLTDDRAPIWSGMVAAVCAAIAVQLHVQAGVFGVLLLGVLVVRWRKIGTARALGFAGLAALVVLPLVLGFYASATSGAETHRQAYLARDGAGTLADPLDVLLFVSSHARPAWAESTDLLGAPLWLLLVGVGILVTIKERLAIGWLLIANVLIGLALQLGLFAYALAPRYLHTDMVAFIGLGAIGIGGLIRWLPTVQVGQVAVGFATVGLVGAAIVTAVPKATPAPLLSGAEQHAIAAVVAPLGISEDQAHGLYVSDVPSLIGMSYFHRAASSGTEVSDTHVLVAPAGLGLRPLSEGEPTIQHMGNVEVIEFTPAIEPLAVEGPRGPDLLRRWPDRISAPQVDILNTTALHTLQTRARSAGTINVLVRSEPGDARCRVTGTLNGRVIAAETTDHLWTLHRFPVTPGQLLFEIGPCAGRVFVDVF
ncbi:MAG: hypothetical protein ACI9OJ_003811 [Myxococcota bacterium]|jgi:hypothetical protein